MDAKTEIGEKPKPEVIRLDQLLDPLVIPGSIYTHYYQERTVNLDIPGFPQLSIEVRYSDLTWDDRNSQERGRDKWEYDVWTNRMTNDFIPFEPSLGYTVNDEDFTPEQRDKKLNRRRSNEEQEKSRTSHPLSLDLIVGNVLHIPSSEEFRNFLKANPDKQSILKQLRFRLLLPNSTFESRLTTSIDEDYSHDKVIEQFISDGYTWFSTFYPAETGPLNPTWKKTTDGGLYEVNQLRLPKDPLKLAQVKGLFTLAKEGLVVDYKRLVTPGPFIP